MKVQTSKSIAVVGAGAAGLITAHRLRESGLQVKIFEAKAGIGGVWNYQAGSVLYKSLVTNLPKEVMAYNAQTPFPSNLSSFLHHTDVYEYLQCFAERHALLDLILFSSLVTSIRRLGPCIHSEPLPNFTFNEAENKLHANDVNDNEAQRWVLDYICQGCKHTEEFDAICVCNGHYNEPYLPQIPGLETFEGDVMHSCSYDEPTRWSRKKVLVVGARASGTDIARELSLAGAEVYVCERSRTSGVDYHSNEGSTVFVRGPISHITQTEVAFEDGTIVPIDSIILCTGYTYAFPFLEEGLLENATNGEAVSPLYWQLFHLRYPTLAFVGLPWSVIPFMLFDNQAQWIAGVLSGQTTLPSYGSRTSESQTFTHTAVPRGKLAHYLGPQQWDYNRELARRGGFYTEDFEKHLQLMQEIYDDVSAVRPDYPGAPDNYRRREYRVFTSDDTDTDTGTQLYKWTVNPSPPAAT